MHNMMGRTGLLAYKFYLRIHVLCAAIVVFKQVLHRIFHDCQINKTACEFLNKMWDIIVLFWEIFLSFTPNLR